MKAKDLDIEYMKEKLALIAIERMTEIQKESHLIDYITTCMFNNIDEEKLRRLYDETMESREEANLYYNEE